MSSEQEHLKQTIAALEGQRAALGDQVVETALAPLREKLAALQAQESSTRQRKQVTVLFADVSGFTAMSETMDPEQVSQMMNALWQRLDTTITAHGGVIDKHIGDAVMALFGVPVAREDAPEQAIRSALQMQTELREFAQKQQIIGLRREQLASLQMRIGINTGLVLLGTVGTTTEYTAIGDAVNVASRLEHAAPLGGVLISHETYRHVRGLFEVRPLDPITVKGKADPIQVYVVEGVRPRAFRVPTRGVVGIETRTIGREVELEQLKATFQEAQQRTQVVTVVADAGTGKSRLLYEFANWLDVQAERVRLFRARATEEMVNLPYSLIHDLFAFQFEIHEADSAAVAREKFERGILDILGSQSAEQASFIGYLIGFDYSSSPHLHGILHDARQIRDRAFHYMTQIFRQLMAEQPISMFLEDIHWADDSSLNLVEHLVRECRDLPLLIVALSRNTLFERHPSWGKDPGYIRLNLAALSPEDSNRLVDEILRKLPKIPQKLRDVIVRRAEGNPFYVEEVVKILIDDGIIETGDVWHVHMDKLKEIKVPPTLIGVLQARLDGLPPVERQTLQRASVVGRVFWDDAVNILTADAEAAPAPESPVLDETLANLQSRELVFRHTSSSFSHTDEFIFKHAVLRDVTYESVLMELRRTYHAQIAAWLAERSSDRAGEFAGRIGEHYERAGDPLRAAEWHSLAGRQAKATYAPETAASYFRRALKLWAENPDATADLQDERVKLLEELGTVLSWLGRFTESAEAYEAMRDAAHEIGDARAEARGWQGMASAQMYQGNIPAALEAATHAEEVARSAGADLELAMTLLLQGGARIRFGDPETALKLGEEATALARKIADDTQTANGLNFLGGMNFMLGRYDVAASYLEDALKIFQKLGSRDKAIDLLNNLGVIAEAHGDYGAAFERYQNALITAREIGRRNKELRYLTNLGGVRVKLGEFADAEADLTGAINLAENAKIGTLSETYRLLAEAYLGQGRLEDALEAARHALNLGQQFEAQDNIAGAWRTLGMIAATLRRPVTVEGDSPQTCNAAMCFEQSLQIYSKIRMEGEQASTLRAWARFELEQGDRSRGEEMWNQAREIFERLGAKLEAERMAALPNAGG